MKKKKENDRGNLSYWLLGVFFLTICISSFFSELYQNPKNLNKVETGSYLPLSLEAEKLKSIHLKNRLGDFHFERGNLGWRLTFPRAIPAKEESINFILSNIKGIKVDKVFLLDSVEEANLYLNLPFMEVTIIHNNKSSQTIKFGMIDSKNYTTYIGITGKEKIYQVNSFQNPIEKLDLMYFIDPRVFHFSPSKILSYKIFDGFNLEPILSLFQYRGNWMGKKGQVLNQDKVHEYFKSLNTLKSEVILDQLPEELKIKINKSIEKPLFIVEIQDAENKKYQFQICSIANSIPDLKIDRRESILVSSNYSEQKYLLTKKFLEVFRKKEESL